MPRRNRSELSGLGEHRISWGLSRRTVIRAGAGAIGGMLLPTPFILPAWAADQPPIGTWPAGSEGTTVTIGATVPRTGPYAVQGEDEIKGMQLAVEHINSGDPLIKKIAPKIEKGVLGKQVALVIADSAAKPNEAVQEQQRFIDENKIVAMTGSTSSAVAVALNKFAEREKILYLVAISGSNDTTGKDCARYSFRQCFYGESAANAIGPVLVKNFGKGKKAAFMTPDYTYGHTVTKSVNDYLTKNGGWTMVTNQISPLGTQDFSQYLTNIANSGADVIVNVNWGRDAVLSIQQAKPVRPDPENEARGPLPDPVPCEGGRSGAHRRRVRGNRFLVDAGRQVSARQRCSSRPSTRSTATSPNGAPTTPTCNSRPGRAWSRKRAASIRPTSSSSMKRARHSRRRSAMSTSALRITSSCARSSSCAARAPKDMKTKEDYWEVVDVVPGEPLMQKPDAFGCHLGDYT